MLTFGSVCSGIEAASVAWHPLGWKASFLSEIAAFPRAVLSHHYPDVPLRGDFTEIQLGDHAPIDVLVGGTPCQSFSIAGLRGGLADERGNLALEYLRLADRLRPRWTVWENVPGVLSSGKGRDFGSFLGGLVECGYGFAYRVLDAQYFGLAQRRKRVFVVGYLGDWRRAASVLFEPESLRGHPAPSRQKGERVAGTLAAGAHPSGFNGRDAERGNIVHSLRADGFDASEDGTGRGTPLVPVAFRTSPNCGAWETGERVDALTTGTDPTSHVLAFSCKDHGADSAEGVAPTLRAMGHSGSHANAGGQLAAHIGSSVRRLTPEECEALQGFPRGYTLIPYRGKPAADGPRYKALGNSMAVPCMAWIGSRIQMIDSETMKERAA